MYPFYVVAEIEHNAGENIKDERETHSKKRRINKK